MILVGAILVAVLYLSSPWNVILVAGAIAFEIAETYLWIRLSQRWRVRAGAETLIGARAVAVSDLDPEGQVRVQGELWQARAATTAAAGDLLRVTAREGLVLAVEPAGEGRS